MTLDLGGDPGILGRSVYDGGSLRLVGHLFIGGAVTSESMPPTSNDIDFGAPDFCSDDLFFGNEFRNKLDSNVFYGAVKTLHKTGTLTTDTAVPIPFDETPPSDHLVNQYYDSSDSEDEPEPPDHAAPRKCLQYRAYG